MFVFGSNLAGRHLGGSAAHAHKNEGAEWGVGAGPTGNSYAIPTLDENLEKLPLKVISQYVTLFKLYAIIHSEITFDVVAIGCGIAGFSPSEIAPMFRGSPDNVNLPEEFKEERLEISGYEPVDTTKLYGPLNEAIAYLQEQLEKNKDKTSFRLGEDQVGEEETELVFFYTRPETDTEMQRRLSFQKRLFDKQRESKARAKELRRQQYLQLKGEFENDN